MFHGIDLGTIVDVGSKVVAAAAAIAALTPTPKDDSILSGIRKVIDFFALNIFNARNGK